MWTGASDALMAINASSRALQYLGLAGDSSGVGPLVETMLITELLDSRTDRTFAPPLLGASLMLHLAVVVASVSANAAPPRADLSGVTAWGYQLQQVEPDLVAASLTDLMVVDFARDGSVAQAFTHADVALMQRKPDGQRRIVLAYLSIGEAEDYRSYWQKSWSTSQPDWLGEENPDWPGNYAVRYWDPDWQSLILGAPGAYLDAILEAGFDGVYLDRVDAFEVHDRAMSRPARMRAMADFVAAIATYGRQRHPGFVVLGQNGEELLADAVYAEAIDAVGKEDLFFGLAGDGALNSKSELRASLTPLQKFLASGKPVFVVEYLETPASKALARQQASALGVPLFIGNRELDDVRSR